MGDAQYGLDWHLGIENGAVGGVADNRHYVALLHVFMTDDEVVGNGYLLEGFLVHEDAAFLVFIEILVVAVLDDYVLQLLADVVAALQHAAVCDVLHLDVHDGVSLAGLAVLEVYAHPNGTIHADGGTFLNVL